MKKILLVMIIAVFSQTTLANNSLHCGEVERLRIWANGSDTYGVWVEYDNNPASCPGGFYLKHTSSNKDLVYSFLLAAKTAKENVCIQTSGTTMIGNRCLVNYVMDQ